MTERSYKMIEECVTHYRIDERDDGSSVITLEVSRRFSDLWLVKLSELCATDAEIAEYEK